MSNENNFYASFISISKTKIKEAFVSNGWVQRMANWTDFELNNDWSELTLEGDENEPLLNGKVTFHQSNIDILNKIFNELEAQYFYEFYDEHKKLILEKKN